MLTRGILSWQQCRRGNWFARHVLWTCVGPTYDRKLANVIAATKKHRRLYSTSCSSKSHLGPRRMHGAARAVNELHL